MRSLHRGLPSRGILDGQLVQAMGGWDFNA